MKRFTYETLRRFCPSCDGDGKGRIFPAADCWRCGGEGHLPEEPPLGERCVVLVHDQSGQVVDIKVRPGTSSADVGRATATFVVAIVLIAMLTLILAFH